MRELLLSTTTPAHLHHIAGRHAAAGSEGKRPCLLLSYVGDYTPASPLGASGVCIRPPTGPTPPAAHRPHLRHFSKSTVMEAELESCHSSACATCSSSHSWLQMGSAWGGREGELAGSLRAGMVCNQGWQGGRQ